MTEDPFHKATLLKRRLGVREDKSEYFDPRFSRKLTKSKYFWHSIQPIYIFVQGIRQRNRTNLLTAKQSLNLLLITTICGGGSTFVNVIYPAIKGQKPEIMWVSDEIRFLDIFSNSFLIRILVQAFLTLAGILVETGETYYSCLENDLWIFCRRLENLLMFLEDLRLCYICMLKI